MKESIPALKHPLLQQNLLDKVITYFDPKKGAQRMAARSALAMAGGYTGAKINRTALSNWKPGGGSPEADIIPDLPMLRDRTRDAVRNAPVATGAINSTVSAVVGTGLSCNPAINHAVLGISEDEATQWNANTRERFDVWASSIESDITQRQDFYGLQDLTERSSYESGDCWVITPLVQHTDGSHQLALQIIEADRICNPMGRQNSDTLQEGVELDPETMRSVAIYVAKRHPGGLRVVGNTWERIEVRGAQTGRRNVLQRWKQLRPNQVRGVPILAPILEPLKQLTRWSDNELNAAVTSSLFTMFVKMDPDAFADLFDDDAKKGLVQRSDWSNELDNGKAINLLPGEEIQTAAMNRPNPEFDPFWTAMVRQIGMAIQIPYEVLIMHFQSSYTAARGALLLAWRLYRERRDSLAKQMCQPVYELWLENEISEGRIVAPGFFASAFIKAAWCKAMWTGDGPGSVDPEKEVNAAEKRVNLGTSTLQAESILHDGVDWEAKNRQRAREIEAQKKAGTYRAPPATGAPAPPPAEPEDGSPGVPVPPALPRVPKPR